MRLRFRIRALLLLVLFLGMLLGIGALTLENRRLRTALAMSQKEVASLKTQTLVGNLVLDYDGDGWIDLKLVDSRAAEPASSMPNGTDVFAGQ
jgi:hypothetical protein